MCLELDNSMCVEFHWHTKRLYIYTKSLKERYYPLLGGIVAMGIGTL